MPKGRTFLTSLAVAAVLTLPIQARAETPSVDTVVASVNGTTITVGHMMLALATLPQQYQQLPADTLFDALLDQLIQQETLRQSNPEAPNHVKLALENEQRSLFAGDAIEKIMQNAVSDAEIEQAYDAEYANSGGATEFNASHILVETEQEAIQIVAELEGGADFATMAAAVSTGPSGPNGGALGWFGAGMMVPEFEAAVTDLKAGEISLPVQTQFGWHVIVLNDTRLAEAPALDDVYEEIATRLRRDAVTAHVDDLVAKATVERPTIEGLDPEMLRDLDLLRN
jgi:peptidyl-prolyl cis-trans isomerase C